MEMVHLIKSDEGKNAVVFGASVDAIKKDMTYLFYLAEGFTEKASYNVELLNGEEDLPDCIESAG